MRPLIYPMVAAALLLCTWAIGSTPAEAAITVPHLQSYAGSTVTPFTAGVIGIATGDAATVGAGGTVTAVGENCQNAATTALRGGKQSSLQARD